VCVERGFPNFESSRRQERGGREAVAATAISLSAKRELLLFSFFAAELFFFLHSPFDF